jgi:phosphoribosylformylglycinamidine (FGAM) synthase PurS component
MIKANIDVVLKGSILDPQEAAVKDVLKKLGFDVIDVRMRKLHNSNFSKPSIALCCLKPCIYRCI